MSQLVSAQAAAAITLSDTVDTRLTRGLYVGVPGDVKVDMADGSTVTFTNLSSGGIHAIAVRRVYLTGTTATGIIGVY